MSVSPMPDELYALVAEKSNRFSRVSPAGKPELVASVTIRRKYHSDAGSRDPSCKRDPVPSGPSYSRAVPAGSISTDYVVFASPEDRLAPTESPEPYSRFVVPVISDWFQRTFPLSGMYPSVS